MSILVIGDIHGRLDLLEELIKKSYFNNVVKIVNFVSTNDRKFYELDMVKREIEIVLSSLRSIISGNLESSCLSIFLPLFYKHLCATWSSIPYIFAYCASAKTCFLCYLCHVVAFIINSVHFLCYFIRHF